MQPSQNAFDLAKRFEGLKLSSYKNNGDVWTIGFGHTLDVKEGDIITISRANELLSEDMNDAADCVNKLVTSDINQNQFDAICDFVFNLGWSHFESSHLLTYINQSNFDLAAEEFKKWVYSNGCVLSGLVNRREAEKDLFIRAM